MFGGVGGTDADGGSVVDDTIDAGAGDDSILAGDGADTVFGGAGDDVILGGAGHDLGTIRDVARGDADSLLIRLDDGSVLRVADASLNSYDVYRAQATTTGNTTSGGDDDGEIGVDALLANTDAGAIYRFTDSTGGDFTVAAGDSDSLLITRASGEVLRIADASANSYDTYTTTATSGGDNDGVIDIEALSANADAGAIFRFTDSGGGDFSVTAGDNYSLLITRDNGEVLRVPDYYLNNFDTYTTSGTSGGDNDGEIDISALSANADALNIAKFTDSSGQGFTVETGDGDSLIITRDSGEVLRIHDSANVYGSSSLNTYDTYTTTGTTGGTNDGVIDVEALSANADAGAIYRFTDSSGQDFTVEAGDSDSLIITREDGEILRIADASLNTYDTYTTTGTTGGTNDGTIDIHALAENVDNANVYRIAAAIRSPQTTVAILWMETQATTPSLPGLATIRSPAERATTP